MKNFRQIRTLILNNSNHNREMVATEDFQLSHQFKDLLDQKDRNTSTIFQPKKHLEKLTLPHLKSVQLPTEKYNQKMKKECKKDKKENANRENCEEKEIHKQKILVEIVHDQVEVVTYKVEVSIKLLRANINNLQFKTMSRKTSMEKKNSKIHMRILQEVVPKNQVTRANNPRLINDPPINSSPKYNNPRRRGKAQVAPNPSYLLRTNLLTYLPLLGKDHRI